MERDSALKGRDGWGWERATRITPFQGLVSVRRDTQGVALGYRMMPRWGGRSSAHRATSSLDSKSFTLTSPLSNFGNSVSRRVARSRDSAKFSMIDWQLG